MTVAVTYEEAEELLLSYRNPRLKAQYAEGIINPIVLAGAVGVKPQMIYNYIRNGKIKTIDLDAPQPGVSTNNTQHIVIAWGVAVLWTQKYLQKKADHQERVERELRGEVVTWRTSLTQ